MSELYFSTATGETVEIHTVHRANYMEPRDHTEPELVNTIGLNETLLAAFFAFLLDKKLIKVKKNVISVNKITKKRLFQAATDYLGSDGLPEEEKKEKLREKRWAPYTFGITENENKTT